MVVQAAAVRAVEAQRTAGPVLMAAMEDRGGRWLPAAVERQTRPERATRF